MAKNVNLEANYKQVCVWPGTVTEGRIPEFIKFMNDTFGIRIQYLEEIETNPDVENGVIVEETGGRNDIIFAVHNDDIVKFAVPRLAYGIRWIDDMYLNNNGYLYPTRVKNYCSWN